MAKVTPTTSSKPGTQVTEGKEKKAKRIDHPMLKSLKKDEKLTAIPDGFDFTQHKPIKSKFFEKKQDYFELAARKCEWQAAGLRKKAAEEAAGGGDTKNKGKLKRLAKMSEKMTDLRKTLEAAGINVEEYLTKMLANQAAATAK